MHSIGSVVLDIVKFHISYTKLKPAWRVLKKPIRFCFFVFSFFPKLMEMFGNHKKAHIQIQVKVYFYLFIYFLFCFVLFLSSIA